MPLGWKSFHASIWSNCEVTVTIVWVICLSSQNGTDRFRINFTVDNFPCRMMTMWAVIFTLGNYALRMKHDELNTRLKLWNMFKNIKVWAKINLLIPPKETKACSKYRKSQTSKFGPSCFALKFLKLEIWLVFGLFFFFFWRVMLLLIYAAWFLFIFCTHLILYQRDQISIKMISYRIMNETVWPQCDQV